MARSMARQVRPSPKCNLRNVRGRGITAEDQPQCNNPTDLFFHLGITVLKKEAQAYIDQLRRELSDGEIAKKAKTIVKGGWLFGRGSLYLRDGQSTVHGTSPICKMILSCPPLSLANEIIIVRSEAQQYRSFLERANLIHEGAEPARLQGCHPIVP